MPRAETYPPPYIGLDELRNLLRPTRKMFLPDHIANAIKNRDLAIRSSEAGQIALILERLIDELRHRLHDDGFELLANGKEVEERMPKKERDRAENLAYLMALQTTTLAIEDRLDDAERHGLEGIRWARMAGAHVAETHVQISLSFCYSADKRPAQELEALEQAVASARRSRDDETIVHGLNNYIIALVSTDLMSRAEESLEEAFALAGSKLTEDRRTLYLPRLLLSRGRIAAIRREQEQAIILFREALQMISPDRDPLMYMATLSHLGMSYSGLGDDQKALEYFMDMTRIAVDIGDAIPIAWGYYRIGEVYSNMGENREAEKAFRLSLEYSPKHYILPPHYVYSKQAEICLREGRIEEGIELCHLMLTANPEEWSPTHATDIYISLGRLQDGCGRLAEAEDAFRRAIDICTQTEANDRSAYIKRYLARVLIKEGRIEEAEELLLQVIPIKIRMMDDRSTVIEAYRSLAQIAEGQNDHREALQYERRVIECERELWQLRTEQALQKARVLAEVELLEREAQLERERRRNAEQELAQTIISLKGKMDVLEKVERQLKGVLIGIADEKAREITASLKQLLSEIDLTAQDPVHPLSYIQGIDREFFLRLRTRWPGLTRKQERLCGLIRAGLTAQEVASILNLSYEGVRAQRKRLRKQLGLDSEASLEGVIADV